ncbi:MAG: Asp-tRNA(Asn)/Glu-tRNA(Gln) amidotransferase subunit GatC [Chlamydiota bacterium]|jgi:aspartyl-tRNA(Asn)/glutamyl-tRNA(Gln) amidotransferase subunit C
MEKFNYQNLEDLQKLARIKLKDEEKKDLLESLQKIVEYIDQLDSIDTKDVACCNHVSQVQNENVIRDDVVGELLSRETLLENAPDQIGGMIRTPPIMQD